MAGELRIGYPALVTLALPSRIYAGAGETGRPDPMEVGKRTASHERVSTPLDVLASGETGTADAWPTATRQALSRLEAIWLLLEDRLRVLDVSLVEPLAHQAALVEHIVRSPDLRRVLIADEVGLGKTVEVGLLIKRLMQIRPQLRVLYLTEARLAPNVLDEFERLDLPTTPRLWTAEVAQARLEAGRSDPLVIASIHKAVANRKLVAASGPWDLIVVDEAHHLTDYSPSGSDPRLRMSLVRGLVRDRLALDGRLVLMSGTPHQGHRDRFLNLLRLLSDSGDPADARGKVIYRIKDDITDWDGQPLFPVRQVNPPLELAVQGEYVHWLSDVHLLLEPGPGASRAAGWRRAQALQWCASSPQAGLAYMVRLALRHPAVHERMPELEAALSALRPYRGGPEDEPVNALRARLMKQLPELDEDLEESFSGGRHALAAVLTRGTQLVETDALSDKLRPLLQLISDCSPEKVVVFAQPVETVHALQIRLAATLGKGSVAIIVGSQDGATRQEQIRRFREDPSVRVLVSSRAGGEGINLQLSRRLVHFDVPWNPMELEQRVGRVHRFGSVDTIIVDTLLFAGSRESRVLARARARLGRIATDLDSNRAEMIFSRTMSLIPLEELAMLMAGENFGPLTDAEESRLDLLVTEGYTRLQQSESDFRSQKAQIESLSRGSVRVEDLAAWLCRNADATPTAGVTRAVLSSDGASGARSTARAPLPAITLRNGQTHSLSRETILQPLDAAGKPIDVVPLGMNQPGIADVLREAVDGVGQLGAGGVLIDSTTWRRLVETLPSGDSFLRGGILLAAARQCLDSDEQELGASLHGALVSSDGSITTELSDEFLAMLLRSLRDARPKLRPSLSTNAHTAGNNWMETLRKVGSADGMIGIFPWAAIQVEVG